jgi:hypothetical protein
MTERELRRWIQQGSEGFRALNPHLAHPSGTQEPKRVVGKSLEKTRSRQGVGTRYRLRHVGITFHNASGKRYDPDNRGYVGKVAVDALVNLGFCDDDAEIETSVEQRLDDSDPHV